jgi:hypothetical protein
MIHSAAYESFRAAGGWAFQFFPSNLRQKMTGTLHFGINCMRDKNTVARES